MSDPAAASDLLIATRVALQSVAEHVLSADLHRSNGRIGLRATPGGFGTPRVDTADGPRRSRVAGTDIVLDLGDRTTSEPLLTLGQAAAFVGVPLGAPARVYQPTTVADADAPLALDPECAHRLADWFALVDLALTAFAARHPADEPGEAQLWPEHFDLAISAGEINYGGSPGDAEHPEPYLYVGPWTVPDGPYWNEPFGVSHPWTAVESVDVAVELFETARTRATG